MLEIKTKELVFASLVVDSYCLGAHWVYDEKQLRDENIDWESLNAPLALWHKGKKAGDFTHYGDQVLWLYEFLEDKTTFNQDDFSLFWFEKMQSYTGYIDGASRNTMENIKQKIKPSGSSSTDLSIVGRIVSLLKVSQNPVDFYENVQKFIQTTHNSEKAILCGDFFAKLLMMVLEKNDIEMAILKLKNDYPPAFQAMIQKGVDSKEKETFDTIRAFGSACDIDEGFSGVIHLLCKYKNIKDMLQENAKAGGDSSARGMIASMIFLANHSLEQIPQQWRNINKTLA